MLYFVKTPNFIKKLFPKLIWNIPVDKKVIYLTFDDGPTPEITNWVLNELKRYNAKATFFCIGKNIAENPSILKNIIANGHTVGNHTNNHLNKWNVSKKTYLEDINQTHNILLKHIGLQTETKKLFRPPYGKIGHHTANKLLKKGYKVIMWDVLSGDFDLSITPEKCLENVLKNTTNGSIVVCHDSVKASSHLNYCLPKILLHYTEKGYEFKSL